MTKKRIVLLVIAATVLCFIVLRETGVIDASLYKSALSISQVSTSTGTNSGDEHSSYHVKAKYKNETIYDLTHSGNSQPPIEIEAMLEEPVYSGNCALPLMKNFKMTYRCEFKTVKPPNANEVVGKIQGEVSVRILGFCSRRKARQLAFEEAKQHVISYCDKLKP